MEERAVSLPAELLPEVTDVNIHHVAHRVELEVPDLFQQLGPTHDALRVQEKKLEELELFRGEFEPLAAALGPMSHTVQINVVV